MEDQSSQTHRQARHYLRRLGRREQSFFSHDGQVFGSVQELAEGLGRMSKDTFTFHSRAERSDFADWVRQIIGDPILAQALERSRRHLTQAVHQTARRLKQLQHELNSTATGDSYDEQFYLLEES